VKGTYNTTGESRMVRQELKGFPRKVGTTPKQKQEHVKKKPCELSLKRKLTKKGRDTTNNKKGAFTGGLEGTTSRFP